MVTVSASQEQSGQGQSRQGQPGTGGSWALVERLACAEGSATHPHRRALVEGVATHRDLSDVIHALCAVHGRHPDMVEEALFHAAHPDAHDWLREVAEGFAAERGYLARLVSAAGPLPSTPGQAASETALSAQRHALAMLARSDRRGCATGAVAALALDWLAIRPVLDRAAERFGIVPVPDRMPPANANALAGLEPGAERALAFGAQQLLAQVRGLWDLLETRAGARA